ncbi:MAG: metal-dependent hydrolase [Halohasta sp.]
MYVLGHVGISLLLSAPFVAVALSTGQPLVAALTAAIMVALGPLPDLDTYTDRLAHRGPTHTVWFALGVGLAAAVVAAIVAAAVDAATVANAGTVAVDAADTQYISSHFLPPLAPAIWFGGASALAVGGHLAGDLLTPMGLWPFRPLSGWHYTADLTPSKSPRANRVCFGVGSLALFAAVLVAPL